MTRIAWPTAIVRAGAAMTGDAAKSADRYEFFLVETAQPA